MLVLESFSVTRKKKKNLSLLNIIAEYEIIKYNII